MFRRDEMLAQLRAKPSFDIIIVGGGATGLGAAVEAAMRGHRTLLLEAGDFAQGTSSRSTKLVHGGVRYLRSGQIKMVREALHERERLLRNARSIVHPLRFVIPSFRRGGRWYYYGGLKAYDWLAGRTQLPPAELLTRSQCASSLPQLESKGLRGGVAFSDGQFDDARLAVALAQAAASAGGVVLNYSPVVRLLSRRGRIVGVVTKNKEQGTEHEIEGRVVINATGVFASQLWEMESATLPGEGKAVPSIVPSQGTHVVLPASFWTSQQALLIPDTPDGRVLFVIPWHGHTLLGTTDVVVPQFEREPRPTAAEIDYLLANVGNYLQLKPGRGDVLSAFAGLRPLVGQGGNSGKSSASLSREHELHISPGKLVSVVGGKWTTYRLMGEQLIDVAEQVADVPHRSSATRDLKLTDSRTRHSTAALAGDQSERPNAELTISDADVRHAVQFEMARTVEDVLARRSRTLFLNARRAIHLAPAVAASMASELGRDATWQASQQSQFEELAQGYIV